MLNQKEFLDQRTKTQQNLEAEKMILITKIINLNNHQNEKVKRGKASDNKRSF